MFNVIRNNIALFVLVLLLVFMTLLFGILDKLYSSFFTSISNAYSSIGVNSDIILQTHMNTINTRFLLETGVNFVVILITCLTVYSSFVDRYTFKTYIMTFIITIILTSVLIYTMHNIYNILVEHLSLFDIFNISRFTDFLFVHFDKLLVMNVIAFLMSAIFVR